MKLLLDTHVFIWWADAPEQLSAVALAALENGTNELILSVASVWEMQIKIQLGKLKMSAPLRDLVESQQTANGISLLPIKLAHVLAIDVLPPHHKDPFDRLLIAQSITEGLTLVSADARLSVYPVSLLAW
ncbi:MAG: type II toxin-antitoxin system VapC family toxin [Pyrinomonadaceae bacterium]